MTDAFEESTSYWTSTASFSHYAKLSEDLETDVLVVGGGSTGLTTAYLLTQAGKRVVVLERDRCALGDTGRTSAHLTMVTDTRLQRLVSAVGEPHARAVWDAGLAAIGQIDEIQRTLGEEVGFSWVDAYLHASGTATRDSDVESLRRDEALARGFGFDVEFVDEVPVVRSPGLKIGGQARIHPRKYLAAVARALVSAGGRIFEHSEATDFCDSPRSVKANGHAVVFTDVVIATHNPLVGLSGVAGATLFQTKLALYTSYVVAGRVAKGSVPDALWWDTGEPYRYLRVEPHRDFDVVIFGGEDHKTGQERDTETSYRRLEEALRALLPAVTLTNRWSGQVIETPDGLPYVGEMVTHQYAATGFCGNGLTFGALSAMMIADAIAGRTNPWAELFHPGRKVLTRGVWDYLKENADYPYYLIRDRFAGADGRSLRAVARGHGAIVEHNGQKAAAYRSPNGTVTLRSPVCSHMGCLVAWNGAERTWDCPCHGSRFRPTGEVIAGPAEAPLAEFRE